MSCALLCLAPGARASSADSLLDSFEDLSRWSAHPSEGVDVRISPDSGSSGRSMRLDFHFLKGGGYALVRREISIRLPANYAFSFQVRGQCRPNNLEFKLIDSTGANVWWSNQRNFDFPFEWTDVTLKKRHIPFAWGPAGGGEILRVAAIEFAVTAGGGGTGSVWIDELRLRALPELGAAQAAPSVSATSWAEGHAPEQVLSGDPGASWESAETDTQPHLTLDFHGPREFGGLDLEWAPGKSAQSYDVETSADGQSWKTLRRVRGGNGGHDLLYLPESEAAMLRIRALGGGFAGSVGLTSFRTLPIETAATREKFFEHAASVSPPGSYPRAFSGQQSYWTVVGVDGGAERALFGEDGAVEAGKAAFSLEPFMRVDGKLWTWREAKPAQRLEGPFPLSIWQAGPVKLEIQPFALGSADSPVVAVRYRLLQSSSRAHQVTLALAIRPFQVNPPTQFLNTPGGCAPIHRLGLESAGAQVDARRIVFVTGPDRLGASTFDGGEIAEWLGQDRLPASAAVVDSFGGASGAFEYEWKLGPGVAREVFVLIPLRGSMPAANSRAIAPTSDGIMRARSAALKVWNSKLERARFSASGPQGPDIANVLKSQLEYILINRKGPALEPGARSYDRAWIRDGALMSSALLRLGDFEDVRAFLEWFATFQFDSGKIPCCVDDRGADPVPENDSGGEFLFLVAEYVRYTGDREVAEKLWPRIAAATAYLDSLRQMRRTPEYQAEDKRVFFGLLPESISHEGYSAKPMHSYWDDFFALRGFKDAAWLAGACGKAADKVRFSRMRDEFQADLMASIARAMRDHKIDYIPGCAELGDFDATSTTIALDPVGAEGVLPRKDLGRTFDRYMENFDQRERDTTWDVFTPYELRTVGAMVRLGRRAEAGRLLRFFNKYTRPSGWNQWAEVVGRREREPRFLGDMPHTWVASDYIRSALDMFAFVREADSSLVLAAGVQPEWIRAGNQQSCGVTNQRTPFGKLSYSLRQVGRRLRGRIEAGLRIPPGGIVLDPPLSAGLRQARVNGRRADRNAEGKVVVRRLPATIVYSN